MRLTIDLNSNLKKGKKYRISIRPDDHQKQKIIMYQDDLFLDDLWTDARRLCGEERDDMFHNPDELDDLDDELNKILLSDV